MWKWNFICSNVAFDDGEMKLREKKNDEMEKNSKLLLFDKNGK